MGVLEERLTKQGLVTEPVNTKVTTRQTYTLTGIEGTLASEGGKLTFREQDGIDYAASTVQLPGGERVPFLFTVKNPWQRPIRVPTSTRRPSSPAPSRCPRTAPASSSTPRAVVRRPATTMLSLCRRCRQEEMSRCSRRTTRSSKYWTAALTSRLRG